MKKYYNDLKMVIWFWYKIKEVNDIFYINWQYFLIQLKIK